MLISPPRCDQDATLVSQFQDYLVRGTFTDISVSILQKNLKYSIRCHQSVLACSSKFFEDLLKDVSYDEDASIIFTDMSNDELELLISFVYTGSVTFASSTESQRFNSLIHQLGIHVDPVKGTAQIDRVEEAHSPDDDLSTLMVDDFGQSTVDQSEILYEFQTAQNAEEVNRILAEIISDYDCNQLPTRAGRDFENKIDSGGSSPNLKSPSDSTNSSINSNPFKGRKTKMVHKCVHCAKSFPSGHYLKFHVNSVHTKSKRIGCDLCPKSFSEHYYLRQHIKRMHSLVRPYVCDICSTCFSIKYDLVVHSRTHASVKKFTCESCEKTYSTKRALQEHSRTHTGEKPYQCNLCKKSFALPKTLRVHFRQHSGERPYLCSHCGMTFVQNSTLRNHLKTNHQNKKNKL